MSAHADGTGPQPDHRASRRRYECARGAVVAPRKPVSRCVGAAHAIRVSVSCLPRREFRLIHHSPLTLTRSISFHLWAAVLVARAVWRLALAFAAGPWHFLTPTGVLVVSTNASRSLTSETLSKVGNFFGGLGGLPPAAPWARGCKSIVKSIHKQQTTIRKPIECAPEASSGGREWAEIDLT